MESSTKIFRRLLDECGVEYMKVDFLDGEHITSFDVNGREYGYHEFPDGGTLLRVWHPSPEQAIAATLGAGTCHIKPWKMERDTGFFDCMECSECGYVTDVSEWAKATYCAGCGRRVEQ